MKTLLKHLMLVLMVVATGVGCSKSKTKQSTQETTPNIPGTGDNGGLAQNPSFVSGSTVALTPVSISRFEDFAGRYVNNITDLQINVDVFDVSSSDDRYGGTIKMTYKENGVWRNPVVTFNSGTSMNDTRYNKWFTVAGKQKFKAMFQDSVGAIILVIEDSTNDFGTFNGKIYYRNFDFSVCSDPAFYQAPICNQQSSLKCWNIRTGPYDCRAYMTNVGCAPDDKDEYGKCMRPDIVDLPGFGSTPYGYSGAGYQLLGTFTNLDITKALNLGLED